MSSQKVTLDKLPLPKRTLQGYLPELKLEDRPSAKRRATTFDAATPAVWARVEPLWAAWPLRITKEEVMEMGVDIEQGQQVSVEDVLKRWDPVEDGEPAASGDEQGSRQASSQRRLLSSKHRMKTKPIILGVSPGALRDSLPHLDVGDAAEVCNSNATESSSAPRELLGDILSGRQLLSIRNEGKSSSYVPWSTRYVGHQFGSYAGQLGDGRAISLLETESPEGGRQEIQLKGAGRTPFSRHADGLAVLRSGVREYLGGEAVAALGIPTTRSLALLTTPDIPVIRETGAEPPSLLARLAPSFIRIGHFQAMNPGEDARMSQQIFFGGNWQRDDAQRSDGGDKGPLDGHGNLEGLAKLVKWCKDEIMGMGDQTVEQWVKEVVRRNAEMVAGWQVYGFCHGVINTDNVSILGLTIDYGPYAFMDIWDQNHICNHSDPSGLYSYRNQPSRILFALDKLVSAVAPLIGYEAERGTAAFADGWSEGATKADVSRWETKMGEVMRGWDADFGRIQKEAEKQGWMKRFGLKTHRTSDDRDVWFDFLTLLHDHALDFHSAFRFLSTFDLSRSSEASYLEAFAAEFAMTTMPVQRDGEVERATEALKAWLKRFAARAQEQAEQDAWTASADPVEDAYRFGTSAKSSDSTPDWQVKRTTAMKRANPRFVLRQWVLEECIKEMEDALGAEFNEEGVKQARAKLGKLLDMASRPFYPWGETDQDSAEEAKLCGLGSRAMLGFQCSCSS